MMTALLVLYNVSIVYIFFFVGREALLCQRRWTLLKNVDWTFENGEFTRQFLGVSLIPFLIATLTALIFVSYAHLMHTEWLPHFYTLGIYAGLAELTLICGPKEILVWKRIPPQSNRTARLTPRYLSSYVPRWIIVVAQSLVVCIYAADLTLFATGVITIHRLLANLIVQTFYIGITYGAILYCLKERAIHVRDISRVTPHDIHEASRRWGIKVLVAALYFGALLFIAGLGCQLFRIELMNPTIHWIIIRLGGKDDFQSLFTGNWYMTLSGIVVILMFPLLHTLMNSRPLRILRSICFAPQA